MEFLKKIIIFCLIISISSCGDDETVQVVDNAHNNSTSGLRWKNEDFPLSIRVPSVYENQLDIAFALESAVDTWNTALGFLALELEYVGANLQYETPKDYLEDGIFSTSFPGTLGMRI